MKNLDRWITNALLLVIALILLLYWRYPADRYTLSNNGRLLLDGATGTVFSLGLRPSDRDGWTEKVISQRSKGYIFETQRILDAQEQ